MDNNNKTLTVLSKKGDSCFPSHVKCNYPAPCLTCALFLVLSSGILDQGSGVLVVFDETPVDKTYENTLELIHEMGKVVDALYSKAKKLQ